MKRRISFEPIEFIHMIATTNMDSYEKPNAVASIFFMNDWFSKKPFPVTHVVTYGENATEEKALDMLTKRIEDYLGKKVSTKRDY